MSTMKIDDYEFVAMAGEIGSWGESVVEITRPGKHGYDLKKEGKRGEAFQLQTKSTHESENVARSVKNQYELLKMEVLRVQKGFEDIANVLILDVKSRIYQITASTDSNTHMVESIWTMKRVNDG